MDKFPKISYLWWSYLFIGNLRIWNRYSTSSRFFSYHMTFVSEFYIKSGFIHHHIGLNLVLEYIDKLGCSSLNVLHTPFSRVDGHPKRLLYLLKTWVHILVVSNTGLSFVYVWARVSLIWLMYLQFRCSVNIVLKGCFWAEKISDYLPHRMLGFYWDPIVLTLGTWSQWVDSGIRWLGSA